MSASRPLRVLHVIDSLGEGGAEQNLLTLVRQLPECEHHLAWFYSHDVLLDAFKQHVKTATYLDVTHGVGHIAAAWRLAKHIRALEPDVVHVELIRAQIVTRVAATLAGRKPVVVTWDCVSYGPDMYVDMGRKGPWLREITRALDAATGLVDAHVIAVSRAVRDYNAKKLGVKSSRVSVIYNAIDPSRIAPSAADTVVALRRSLGLTDDGLLLLSVGRLVDQKSHITSIQAMPAIAHQHPNAVLFIVGSGPLRESLEREVQSRGLEAHVHFLGQRKDVPTLLQAADLFLFPSINEGLGIAMTEALAAGLPVVASSIPTSFEVAEGIDTVTFFRTRDAADMARAVADALRDLEPLKARTQAQAAGVIERFSASTMAQKTREVLERAACRSPRSV